MTSSVKIISVDPSGAFNEGKGVTGILVLDKDAEIEHHEFTMAKEYNGQLNYWQGVIDNLAAVYSWNPGAVLSIEDYVLYGDSAMAQVNSEMETSKLIGALCMWAYNEKIPIYTRNAALVKKRWSNKILEHKGYITKNGNKYTDRRGVWINRHVIDALRHALHCHHFEVGKKEKELM